MLLQNSYTRSPVIVKRLKRQMTQIILSFQTHPATSIITNERSIILTLFPVKRTDLPVCPSHLCIPNYVYASINADSTQG